MTYPEEREQLRVLLDNERRKLGGRWRLSLLRMLASALVHLVHILLPPRSWELAQRLGGVRGQQTPLCVQTP